MDNRVERILNCIGYPQEYYGEFEESFMDNCRTTNAKMNFYAELHLKKFLSYTALKELLSIIEAFGKQPNGFHSELLLSYQKPADENEIRDFLDAYIEEK